MNLPLPEPNAIFISLVILCRDDETVIGRMLESVTGDNRFSDEILVIDTGSKDKTIDVVRLFDGVQLIEEPWPNDFGKARNMAASHANQRTNVVINLDADEVLVGRNQGSTFRKEIEKLWAQGIRTASFRYVFSYKEDGTEKVVMPSQRIFDPKMYHFHGKTHECLVGPDNVLRGHIDKVTVGHFPKAGWSLSKHQRDVHLLEQQVAEEPDNPRWLFYLGREYSILGKHEECVATLQRYLSLSWFMAERQDARLIMADSLLSLGKTREAEEQAVLAHVDYPSSREALVWYMFYLFKNERFMEAIPMGEAALSIPNAEDTVYGARRDTSDFTIHDILAVCYWKANRKDEGRRHIATALMTRPDDPRIIANAKWYAINY